MVAEEFIFVVGLPPTWNVDTCRVGYSSNHILVPTSQNNLIGTCCCPGDYLINDSSNYRGSAKYVCTMYVTHSLMLWWMLATCHGWVLTACITTVFMNTVLSRVMLTSYCRLSGTVLKLSLFLSASLHVTSFPVWPCTLPLEYHLNSTLHVLCPTWHCLTLATCTHVHCKYSSLLN